MRTDCQGGSLLCLSNGTDWSNRLNVVSIFLEFNKVVEIINFLRFGTSFFLLLLKFLNIRENVFCLKRNCKTTSIIIIVGSLSKVGSMFAA